MARKTFVTRILQRYWRLSRGLTLGAQGCVIDGQGRVLLIRHTYRQGWHFPGGGVEKHETVRSALTRELAEEAGVVVEGEPELFGIYANSSHFPGDHIALFVIRSWRQAEVPAPNSEIAEQGFFSTGTLPADINRATADRICEVLGSTGPAEMW
ncbi:MAG: NUDIX domain-containing protein [Hyphomicrobium sp.]